MNIDPKRTVSITEARKRIFAIAKDVQKPGRRYTLTEKGKPKIIIMSAEEYDAWQETLETMRDFPNLKDDTAQAEKDYRTGRLISLEDLLKELGYTKKQLLASKHVRTLRHSPRSKRTRKS